MSSQEEKKSKVILLPVEVDEEGKVRITLLEEIFKEPLKAYEEKITIRRKLPEVDISSCPTITDTSTKEERLRALTCQFLNEYLKLMKEKKEKEGEGKHD
jgi:hypothetical protein